MRRQPAQVFLTTPSSPSPLSSPPDSQSLDLRYLLRAVSVLPLAHDFLSALDLLRVKLSSSTTVRFWCRRGVVYESLNLQLDFRGRDTLRMAYAVLCITQCSDRCRCDPRLSMTCHGMPLITSHPSQLSHRTWPAKIISRSWHLLLHKKLPMSGRADNQSKRNGEASFLRTKAQGYFKRPKKLRGNAPLHSDPSRSGIEAPLSIRLNPKRLSYPGHIHGKKRSGRRVIPSYKQGWAKCGSLCFHSVDSFRPTERCHQLPHQITSDMPSAGNCFYAGPEAHSR